MGANEKLVVGQMMFKKLSLLGQAPAFLWHNDEYERKT